MERYEFFKEMQQGMQTSGGLLKRKPTIAELDEFIDRAMKKADYNIQMLYNDLRMKISNDPRNQQVRFISLYEEKIYPMILNRLEQRHQQGEK